jgi:membrane protease YdiL (CAAX protease family)
LWSNVIFGLAHFVTPTYALLAGILGGYLGWLFTVSGNLLAPIIAHGLYDFLAFLVVARECRHAPPTSPPA